MALYHYHTGYEGSFAVTFPTTPEGRDRAIDYTRIHGGFLRDTAHDPQNVDDVTNRCARAYDALLSLGLSAIDEIGGKVDALLDAAQMAATREDWPAASNRLLAAEHEIRRHQ